jgi:hypothetical protein
LFGCTAKTEAPTPARPPIPITVRDVRGEHVDKCSNDYRRFVEVRLAQTLQSNALDFRNLCKCIPETEAQVRQFYERPLQADWNLIEIAPAAEIESPDFIPISGRLWTRMVDKVYVATLARSDQTVKTSPSPNGIGLVRVAGAAEHSLLYVGVRRSESGQLIFIPYQIQDDPFNLRAGECVVPSN